MLLVDSCRRAQLCVVLLGVGDRALVVVCLLFLLLYVDVCCCGMCSMTPLRLLLVDVVRFFCYWLFVLLFVTGCFWCVAAVCCVCLFVCCM